MGKTELALDLLKAGAKMFKAGGKISLKEANNLKALKGKLPETLARCVESRTGIYKLSPEERVIDALKEVKTKSGKVKFSEEALRAEIKKVNFGIARNFDPKGQYSQLRCLEITKFAERSDVTLRDVAEFSLLPEHSLGFANSLSKDRFKIFKEFMKYTQSDGHILKIGETNPRRFSFEELCFIAAKMPEEQVQTIRKLINIKRPKGHFVSKDEFLFSGEDLLKLLGMAQNGGLDVNGLVKLAKSSGLGSYSITDMAKVKDMDFNEALKVINKIKKSHKGNIVFDVEKDLYEADKFRLLEWSKANDKEILIKTFDNKMNLISTDKIVHVAGKPKQAKIIGKDFEVVIGAHAVPRKNCAPLLTREFEIISETRKIRDKSGNLLRTEYLTSSKVEGLHNWKAVLPDGTVKPIIDVKMSKNGILTVKKNLEALDGTLTKQSYKRLSDGSWVMRLNISRDGKILSKRNIKHKMITSNEAESVVNGKKYKVLYSSDEIKVLNAKGETDCVIDLKSLVDANNTPENALKLKKMLKECSADELQIINKKLKTLEFNTNKFDAFADSFEGKVSTADDIFIFRHEMGHIDDLFGTSSQGIYSNSDKFKKIYSKDLDMFMEEFPQTQRSYVDYFIDHSDLEMSNRSFKETAAELLAANKSPDINVIFGIRTEYLERYFQNTRSFLLNA